MGWCLHGFFVATRTLSFVSTHITWAFALYSGCAYFQLWKSYDIFWLWIYVVTTCAVPRLRYDNLFLQCGYLWRKTCCSGERWRYALKEQDRRIDEEDEKSAKITNAVDLGAILLRLRVSAAMLFGNIHLLLMVARPDHEPLTLRQTFMFGRTPFQLSIWIDLCLFWSMLLQMWCRQCRLCCQLGCWRYYLWCLLVVAIGACLMEIPMFFAFRRLDSTWCNLDLSSRKDDELDLRNVTMTTTKMLKVLAE
jgi:hypothetical protein